MSIKHTLITLTTVAFSALSLAETPTATPPVDPTAAGTTRAEVRAELEIAQRAGLYQLQLSETYDPSSDEARKAQARYEQLRGGPDYQAALQRLQGRKG